MAIFIPRWERYSEASAPENPEIDWSNELAEGLTFATTFDDSKRELVDDRELTLYGDTYVDADGVHFDGSGDYLTIENVVLDSRLTVSTRPLYNSYTGSSYQYFFAFGDISEAGGLLLLSRNNDEKLYTKLASNGHDTHAYLPEGNGKCIAYTVGEGGTDRSYIDGNYVGGRANVAIADGTTKTLHVGSNANLDSNFSGALPYLYIHNRDLSDEAVAALAENPYQIVKARPTLVAVPSTLGGSAPIMASALRGA